MIVLCFIIGWGVFSIVYWRKELFGKSKKEEEEEGPAPAIDMNALFAPGPETEKTQTEGMSEKPEESEPEKPEEDEEEIPPYYNEDGTESDAEREGQDYLTHITVPEAGEKEEKERAVRETVALSEYENLLREVTLLRNKTDVQESELQDLRSRLKHYSRYADLEAFARLERISRDKVAQLVPLAPDGPEEEEAMEEERQEEPEDPVSDFLDDN